MLTEEFSLLKMNFIAFVVSSTDTQQKKHSIVLWSMEEKILVDYMKIVYLHF